MIVRGLDRIHFSSLTHSLSHLLTSLWVFSQAAEACPGCKEALFDPQQLPQRLSAAKGYALSIAALLGVPLLLVAGITWTIFRQVRRVSSPPADSIDTHDVSR